MKSIKNNDDDDINDNENDSNDNKTQQNFKEQLRNILQNISSIIIPLILVANIDSQRLFVAMFPSLVTIMFLLYDYYITIYKNKKQKYHTDDYVVLVKDKQELEDYTINQLYRDIEYYINETIMKKGMKSSLVDENININYIRNNYYDYYYNLKLPETEFITFKFDDEKITISKDIIQSSSNSTTHLRALRIVSSKFSTITNFLKTCQSNYRTYIDSLEKVTYHFYRYNNESKKWIDKKLQTVKNYNNIILPQDLEYRIDKWIKEFNDSKNRYMEKGIPYKLGLLFHGIPGCGKTSLTYAIAYETNRNIYQIPLSNTVNCEELKSIIDTIPEGNIVLFEEIDTCEFFNKREYVDTQKINQMYTKMQKKKKKSEDDFDDDDDDNNDDDDDDDDDDENSENSENNENSENKSSNDHKQHKSLKTKNVFATKKMKKIFNGNGTCDMNMSKNTDIFSSYIKTQMAHILEILDGYNYLHDTIIIMYTNHLDKIDPAIIRPGRIDHKLLLTYADQHQIKKLYYLYYDIEIDNNLAQLIEKRKVTTSFLINTCIIPCFHNMKESIYLALNESKY
jgi:hypothetical protein